MAWNGIDISSHQKSINWDLVKRTNCVQFVMIRAGYGRHVDTYFEKNIASCNRLKIPCGVYWFSYASNVSEAVEEAKMCIKTIRRYQIDYPIAYDLEGDTVKNAKIKKGVTINRALATQIVYAFCNYVENCGYYVMFYANQDYLKNMFDMSKLKRFDLWYAYYHEKCNQKPGIWQRSNSKTVDGISTKVDWDTAYKDYPAIIAKKRSSLRAT